jgi:hypothetical protein
MGFAYGKSCHLRVQTIKRLLLFIMECWQCHAAVEYDPDLRIETARLYGNINKYAYYFTDLLLGSPTPQRASVIVDTGSRLVGFPCKGCSHCGDHLDPAYDVSLSKSARWLGCRDGCKETCFKDHCPYTETYTEGSTISGFWFDDMVELGDSFQKNPPVRARLGCHTNENKLFYTQKANGIMGLAPSEIGVTSDRPTILQDLFRDKKHVDTNIFSICLATWGGRLTVGGYNSTYHTDVSSSGVTWVSLRASHYYFIFPEGISLQGEGPRTPVASGQHSFGVTIVDSGTTYTYFPGPVFHAIVDHLHEYCKGHNNCGAQREGSECYRLVNPIAGPDQFPALRMQFGTGLEVVWPADGYLHQRGELGVWCQTFMENNLFQTVLGISWMIHKDIIFDLARGRLGVAQATCPEHRRQPDLIEESELVGDAPLAVVTEGVPLEGRDGEHSTQVLLVSTLMVLLGAGVACLCLAPRAYIYARMPQATPGSLPLTNQLAAVEDAAAAAEVELAKIQLGHG